MNYYLYRFLFLFLSTVVTAFDHIVTTFLVIDIVQILDLRVSTWCLKLLLQSPMLPAVVYTR